MGDKAEATQAARKGTLFWVFWERKCAKSEEEKGEGEGGDARYNSI